MQKQRLDTFLVEKDFCQSRQQAIGLIRAGWVKVNQRVIDKPGTEIPIEATIEIFSKPPYVSRGGEKLAKAIAEFKIVVSDRICLDGGISTGGFTDCLLQNGAKLVYGVDVGYGQVAWELRQDSRLILKERSNFRYLQPEDLYGGETPANLGVMDLSFISLTKVLPTLWELLIPPKEVILLVKPQFEVGREQIGKKGVVRDRLAQGQAINTVLQAALDLGWQYRGLTNSPLTGPAGNLEYLLWLHLESNLAPPNLNEIHSFCKSV
ncbi:MAG: TlyA family RNA methyltransferase [Gloeocapsa sp. DLM2.Bin57]|nr:MAG: TlyA family RNA methyltransferase [Gloeocapsa sp. DLM2.Bin57]